MAFTSPTKQPKDRNFDIVLFGATGYVGKLTAQYLASSKETTSLRIALAGRNHKELAKLHESLAHANPTAKQWGIIVANALNSNDMASMAESAAVVISTVGPYTRFGSLLIAACARTGTDYVDLCGEALFIREMIDKHDALAQQSGARIVPSCGFDSVPSDLGMWYLYQKAAEPLRDVTMVVKELKGALSGGTIASMLEVSKAARASKAAAKLLFDPHTLSPNTGNTSDRSDSRYSDIVVDNHEGRWLGPFFMANFNTRIVRRSQMLSGNTYGENFRYREAVDMGTGQRAKLKAQLLLLGLGGFMGTLTHPKLGPQAMKLLPAPGEGPSREKLVQGGFELDFIGATESGRRVTATVWAKGDPGYQLTAMMLSEAALCLVADKEPNLVGFGTPATTLGEPYMLRLKAGGMKFH